MSAMESSHRLGSQMNGNPQAAFRDGAREMGAIAIGVATTFVGPEAFLGRMLGSLRLGKLLSRCKIAKTVPTKALDTLKSVKTTGKQPPGFVGGKIFKNKEGRLPSGGKYREYDVDARPASGTSRNAERIVVDENTGKAWYTEDHYGSFREIP